ncbi:hypothetical protein TIFTF001_053129 [Ficus carica]|uniref:Uncharacterized protein n=1 Tax=Ficus carica TaxID=3494 RepID=A0AA88JJ25_FICCA|nr:hypothetical protein TIFTF001_053129 [Ficus carica]
MKRFMMLSSIKNSHEPIQVLVGPRTRARAKRFKKELNNSVRRVLQQEESMFTTDGEQRLILLIIVDPEESQVLSCISSRECHHENTVKIIRGPPGTEVAKPLIIGVVKSSMYKGYRLGDVVLFGNRK